MLTKPINIAIIFLFSYFLTISSNSFAVADPVFPYPPQATFIDACNDCFNTNGWSSTAKSIIGNGQGGVVYLVDYQNRISKKLYVYKERINLPGPIPRYVFSTKTKDVSLNSIEVVQIAELLSIYDLLIQRLNQVAIGIASVDHKTKNELIAVLNTGMSNFLNFIIPAVKAASGFNVITIKPNDFRNSFPVATDIDSAYAFLRSNTAPHKMYTLIDAEGTIPSLLLRFNAITSTLSLGVLGLQQLKIHVKFLFPDGSYILATPDSTIESFEVLSGDGYDANGNKIPFSKADVQGNYYFSPASNSTAFATYIQTWTGHVIINGCSSQAHYSCINYPNGLVCSPISCN